MAREAPRGFLIGWINQLARPSLQRHSGDLMHQCVADSSILQPLHTLSSSTQPDEYFRNVELKFVAAEVSEESRPLFERPFNGESAGDQSYRF